MKPNNASLLGILLGSFKEQKELILKEPWSSHDLNYIWQNISHNPSSSDSSGVKAYELHKALLKQPSLPEMVVNEIFHIYEPISSLNLKPDIYKHPNLGLVNYTQKFQQALDEDNFLELSWLLLSSSCHMQLLAKTLSEDEDLITRWKFLWQLKQSGQEGTLIQQCFSKIVLVSEHKGFLNSFFYYLVNENLLNGSWCHMFIKNKHSNSKILTTIINKQSRNLGEYQFIEILNHTSANEKLISQLLQIYSSQPKDSKIYNEFVRLVKSREDLTNEQLNLIYHMYPHHSELISAIINHPNFSVSIIWQSFLHEKLFETLPSNLQELLKKKLSNY